ncbi:MAG: flavodoxin-dependent (E)-4-hydroxy-3-methylbut-2-enyl-diphosphate synthase [Clostridia bacterium]|nr:flavodoxin-dependent (E)-4-hydroxy-3-methylbut-2-enyl-diphosphate synthase [Clostridia bacterium]
MKNVRNSRAVHLGEIQIGGGAPITVQSMTNAPSGDFDTTERQIRDLLRAGCDIVRIAVPDMDAAGIFSAMRQRGITAPLVADIHFDYKLALAAVKSGASKIRINPGNIGAEWKVREVADACKNAAIPIRIGVNGGSLDKKLLEKYGSPTPEALLESALSQADVLEKMGFSDIVISMKTSSVSDTVSTYRLAAAQCDYPLHVGVTEAGDDYSGLIKNAIGIGSLLVDGIGDTLRVSLTADSVKEVEAGREILRTLGLDAKGGVEIVSCPTCGRTKVDLISLAAKFKEAARGIDTKGKRVKVAIMGCVVNGPGEAREADFGVAGGDGCAVLFRRGKTVSRIEEADVIDVLLKETYAFLAEDKAAGNTSEI